MSSIDSRTLDAAEDYLRHVEEDDRYDPLTADSGWMVQRVKDWQESIGRRRNDIDASDIAIHLVQRAGRQARRAAPKIVAHGDVGSVTHVDTINGSFHL